MPPDAPAPTAAPEAAPPNGAAKAPPPAPDGAKPETPSRPVVQEAPKPAQPRVAPHFIKLRAEERKVAEQRAELERKTAEYEELKALREKDPWAFAQRMGWSARDVAKRAVDEGKETPQDKLLREMADELKQLREESKQRKEREQTQEERDAHAADVAAIGRAVAANPGEFTLIEGEIADGNLEDITAAFEGVYRRDYEPLGEPLTAENIRAIFQTLDGNLRRFYESKASRLQRQSPDRAPEAEQPAKPETKARKHVLSNLEAAERATGDPNPKRPKTREERLARAVAVTRK